MSVSLNNYNKTSTSKANVQQTRKELNRLESAGKRVIDKSETKLQKKAVEKDSNDSFQLNEKSYVPYTYKDYKIDIARSVNLKSSLGSDIGSPAWKLLENKIRRTKKYSVEIEDVNRVMLPRMKQNELIINQTQDRSKLMISKILDESPKGGSYFKSQKYCIDLKKPKLNPHYEFGFEKIYSHIGEEDSKKRIFLNNMIRQRSESYLLNSLNKLNKPLINRSIDTKKPANEITNLFINREYYSSQVNKIKEQLNIRK